MTTAIGLLAVLILALVATATLTPATAQKKTIQVWHTEIDPGAGKVMERMIVEFNKQHPDVEVQVEAISWGGLQPKLLAAIAAGSPPDLAHLLSPAMLPSFAEKQLLLPIDDVVKALGEDNILEGVRRLNQSPDGHYYGLSYAAGVTGVAYRADVLKETGQPVPTTWAEFLKVAKALPVPAKAPATLLLPGEPLFITNLAVELIANNGGTIVDPKTLRPTLNKKPVHEMLEYFRELDRLAQRGWRNSKYLDTYNGFARGDGLMHPLGYLRHTSFIERYAKPELKSADVFRIVPQMRGPSGTARSVSYDGEPWVILKGAKNPEAAKAFLRTFYRPDLYREYVLNVPIHLTPILKSIAESPEYVSHPFIQRWRPWHDHTVAMLKAGRAFPLMMTSFEELRVPYLVEWLGSRIVSDMVLDVLDGKPAAAAAERAQERSEDLVTKLGYKR